MYVLYVNSLMLQSLSIWGGRHFPFYLQWGVVRYIHYNIHISLTSIWLHYRWFFIVLVLTHLTVTVYIHIVYSQWNRTQLSLPYTHIYFIEKPHFLSKVTEYCNFANISFHFVCIIYLNRPGYFIPFLVPYKIHKTFYAQKIYHKTALFWSINIKWKQI